MSFAKTVWGLVFIATILVAINTFFHNQWSQIEVPVSSLESLMDNNLPASFIAQLPEDVHVEDSLPAITLFSRLDISNLDTEEKIQTPMTKGIRKFAVIYQFSGAEDVYFQLRSSLEMVLNTDDTIFDANNLGDYSLYYNDTKRPGSVFFLALIHGKVWGFEYPREQHELFKILFKTLLNEEEN